MLVATLREVDILVELIYFVNNGLVVGVGEEVEQLLSIPTV